MTIVTYTSAHASAFEQLNRQWLEDTGLIEAADEWELANPEEAYLRPGGTILVAEVDGVAVGFCALRPFDASAMELLKLVVDPSSRRGGIARRLVETCIRITRDSGREWLVLTSNSRLTAALRLYEWFGFRYREVPTSVSARYKTADVFMELRVSGSSADAPSASSTPIRQGSKPRK